MVKQLEAKAYLTEIVMLIPNLIKLLYRMAEDERVPTREKAILLATAAYVVSPIDLMPDFIPFIGKVDDLLLVALVLKRFLNSVDESILYEYWDGRTDLLQMIDKVLSYSKYFLPSNVYNRVVNRAHKDTVDVDFEVH